MRDDIIIKELDSKPPKFWDFKDSVSRDHIHGLATYPAVMVPKMQDELMDIITDDESITLLDPFMGSGTVLGLGMEKGYHVIGIDINPYAYLISTVKTTKYVPDRLNETLDLILNQFGKTNVPDLEFRGIEKWYGEKNISELSQIRFIIENISSQKYRKFFWLALGETAKKVSFARSTTSKLHIKSEEDRESQDFDSYEEFEFQARKMINCHIEFYDLMKTKNIAKQKAELKCGDSIEVLNKWVGLRNKVDLIVTSPPYGDNQTTVAYGQNSTLPLRWINVSDFYRGETSFIEETYGGIDRESLGGKRYSLNEIEENGILLKSQSLNKIWELLLSEKQFEKARKVASFVIDFDEALEKIFDTLKPGGYAVFTTGNRNVHGEQVKLDMILAELSEQKEMKVVYDFKRNILNKRYPSKIIKKNNRKIMSINEETVTILRKKGLEI
jgi:site-specific DNA-methyltransferase (cytosine-N4-specific)